MDKESIRDSIKELIAQNKTEEALMVLSSHQFSKIDKELIILNGQYTRIKEELRMNVVSREEGERKINQINLSILDLCKNLEESQGNNFNQVAATPETKISKNWLWLFLIPVVGLLLYFGMEDSAPDISTNSNGANLEKPSTKKMTFENGGLKDLIRVALEVKGDEVKGELTRIVGYDENNKEVYSFVSNTPFKENKRVCMTFSGKQPDFIFRKPTPDGSHCWLIGKTIDGKYGLIIPTSGEDYTYEGYYDAIGEPVVKYNNYDMFLELKQN